MLNKLFQKNSQNQSQRARLEKMRFDSLSDISSDRLVLAAFAGMTVSTVACQIIIAQELNTYMPAVIFGTLGIGLFFISIKDTEKNWQTVADLVNLVFNAFYFMITIYYQRIDLVIFWYYAHMVYAVYSGGIFKGSLTVIFFAILFFSGLYTISPDAVITRDWSRAILYANPSLLFFGYMIVSDRRINLSFKKLLTERDEAKINTERLNLTLKHTGMGILDIGTDHRVEFSNDMAKTILGDPREIIGKHFIGLATFKDEDGRPIFSSDNVISKAIANKGTLKNYRINIAESKTDAHIDVVDIEDAGSVVIIKPIVEQAPAPNLQAA